VYTGGSGQVTVKVNSTNTTIETNFNCSGITNYGRTSQKTAYLVTSIDVPNGTYTFTYEPTASPVHQGAVTGRLASVTLPTGGEISYDYADGTTNNITCVDGSAAEVKRTVHIDSLNAWTYTHTEASSTWTTTLSDPASTFTTTYTFLGIYEIERQVVPNGGSALETVYTCYNSTQPTTSNPCNLSSVDTPITEVTALTQIPRTSSANVYSETDTQYNTQNSVSYANYGLPTDIYQYAFSTSSPPTTKLRYTNIAYYKALNNIGIYSLPQTVSVEDGSNNVIASTTYGYDSKGNQTSISETTNVSQGSSVSASFAYDTNGALKTASDFNGNVTSYINTSCDNALPTVITPPGGGLVRTVLHRNLGLGMRGWRCHRGNGYRQ
jgi:hypothetical protein